MSYQPTRFQRFFIRVFGSIFIELDARGREVYAFRCDLHGYRLACAQGFYKRLVCVDCLKENGGAKLASIKN